MKKEVQSSNWKIIAIVFIVLFSIENLIFIWAFFASEKDTKNEALCYTEYCPSPKFDAYAYDIDSGVCTCFKNNQIAEKNIISRY